MVRWIFFNVISVNSWLYTINFGTESFFISFMINWMGIEDVCTYPWVNITFLTHRAMLLSSWSSCVNCMYLEREWLFIDKNTVSQRRRNSRHLVAQVTKFYVHSFHWHVQNAMICCRSQELLQFLSVIYFFLPPFSTNCSSILPHFIMTSVSWSASQSCFFWIHV